MREVKMYQEIFEKDEIKTKMDLQPIASKAIENKILENRIINPLIAKTEQEWWAKKEIDRRYYLKHRKKILVRQRGYDKENPRAEYKKEWYQKQKNT